MKVNEIFYSLQGEGYHTGAAAIFVRFSGCNLKCPFCDTDFRSFSDLSVNEIVERVRTESEVCRFVVLTGGEPTLQPHLSELIDKLHDNDYYVAMESNGTNLCPSSIDWLTISPKEQFVPNGIVSVKKCNELKVIYDGINEPRHYDIKAQHLYLQPCDHGNADKNKTTLQQCLQYIKTYPQWKLSLQTQKILNVR